MDGSTSSLKGSKIAGTDFTWKKNLYNIGVMEELIFRSARLVEALFEDKAPQKNEERSCGG